MLDGSESPIKTVYFLMRLRASVSSQTASVAEGRGGGIVHRRRFDQEGFSIC